MNHGGRGDVISGERGGAKDTPGVYEVMMHSVIDGQFACICQV
jgi:hypothetical protein